MIDGAMVGRIADFIESGKDPNGYYVRGKTIVEVIDELEDIPKLVRDHVKELLGLSEVSDDTLIDSLQLGIKFGNMHRKSGSDAEKALIMKVINEVRNLNRVPYVNIKGEPIM